MAEVRFIDSLKVGAYSVEGTGTNLNIGNNVNNYLLTATGEVDTIKGEPELIFDSVSLGIGTTPSNSRLEIHHTGSVDNLLLIKNTDTNTGIQIDNTGVLKLLEFTSLPTAVEGGFIYSSDEFWVGVQS